MAPVLRSFLAMNLIATFVACSEAHRCSADNDFALRRCAGSSRKKAARRRLLLLKQRDAAATHPYLGMITVSITWITPLSATMSVLMTLALSTITPPFVRTVSLLP